MAINLFERLPEGAGKTVNKKQLQDFVRELLFERSAGDIATMVQTDYSDLPGAALAIMQTVTAAYQSGDFSKFRPLLDFIFENDRLRGRGKQ